MGGQEFFLAIDRLVSESKIIIDRPKGSKHPKFNSVYELDYGYLEGTSSMDGGGIDVWLGTLENKTCDAIICTLDMLKRDSEIKLLMGCSESEKEIAMKTDNEYMKKIMIRRE